jgi:hypothetical protein
MLKLQNGTYKICFMVTNVLNMAMIQEIVIKNINMKVQISSYGSTSGWKNQSDKILHSKEKLYY